MWRFILTFLILLTPQIVDAYKITIINSYEYDHICGSPQLEGILDVLDSKDFEIENFYMNGRTENLTENQRNQTAKLIKTRIDEFDPDYIITIDDIAFKFLGTKLSKDYKIIYSGLNVPLEKYKVRNINNISGINETIKLDKFLGLIDKINFSPDKIYIIEDFTPTGFNVSKLILEQLKNKTDYPVKLIQVETLYELKQTISSIQSKPRGMIFLLFQSIKNNNDEFMRKQDILEKAITYNNKHFEISENIICVRAGVAFSVAPHFFDMGRKTANILLDAIYSGWESRFYTSDTIIAINSSRLKDLGAHDFYKKLIEVVQYSYGN